MSLTTLAFQIIAKFDAKTLERKLSRAQNDLTRWTTIILFDYLSYEEDGRPVREVLPAGYTIEAALSDAETMNCLKSLLYIRNGSVLYTRRHLIDGSLWVYIRLNDKCISRTITSKRARRYGITCPISNVRRIRYCSKNIGLWC